MILISLFLVIALITAVDIRLFYRVQRDVRTLSERLDAMETRLAVTNVRHSFHAGRAQLHERLKRMEAEA